jgi:hypothetical protein
MLSWSLQMGFRGFADSLTTIGRKKLCRFSRFVYYLMNAGARAGTC